MQQLDHKMAPLTNDRDQISLNLDLLVQNLEIL